MAFSSKGRGVVWPSCTARRLNAAASDIKADAIKWVVGMLVAQAAVVAALVKLL